MRYQIIHEGVGGHVKGEIVDAAVFGAQIDRLLSLGAIVATPDDVSASERGEQVRQELAARQDDPIITSRKRA